LLYEKLIGILKSNFNDDKPLSRSARAQTDVWNQSHEAIKSK